MLVTIILMGVFLIIYKLLDYHYDNPLEKLSINILENLDL